MGIAAALAALSSVPRGAGVAATGPSTTLSPVLVGGTSAASFSASVSGSVASSPGPSGPPGIRAERIQLQRLGIDLKIVEGDGIDAPIGKAAHYPGTGWPDGGTNVYIYAHARTGMFLPLWDVRIGDEAVLTLVDGSQRTYVVDEVLPTVPWDALEYLEQTLTEQLTLQTSTSYDETAPRFVVIAHPSQ